MVFYLRLKVGDSSGPQISEKQTAKSNPRAIFLFPFCQLNKFERVLWNWGPNSRAQCAVTREVAPNSLLWQVLDGNTH